MESDCMMMCLSPEDHMEVLAFLMQMEKLPEFADSQQDRNSLLAVSPESGVSIGLDISGSSSMPPTFCKSSSPDGSSMPVPDPARQHTWSSGAYASPSSLYGNSTGGRKGGRGGGSGCGAGSMEDMREMIFRIAAMQPIHIDPEAVKPPKRRNVRISKDPQSVAARRRRERISERIRILQRIVPGGTKMDTASMLDEAIHYVKFLKRQVQTLEQASVHNKPSVAASSGGGSCLGFPVTRTSNPPNNML
ncbi:hypothetical protein SAY86_032074 [Trapa natans]|uniref:BHLH domain-containing protein n=1 Tax=Trapa natans TaxID=22666 RepID=A0AAN7M865_TRANT|nr:hypothetical protein SAY86_032074 [Trapa natans]